MNGGLKYVIRTSSGKIENSSGKLYGFKHRQAFKKFFLFMEFCKNIKVDFQTIESLEMASDNCAYLQQSGIPVEDDDILIGSLAVANNAILVTKQYKASFTAQRYSA